MKKLSGKWQAQDTMQQFNILQQHEVFVQWEAELLMNHLCNRFKHLLITLGRTTQSECRGAVGCYGHLLLWSFMPAQQAVGAACGGCKKHQLREHLQGVFADQRFDVHGHRHRWPCKRQTIIFWALLQCKISVQHRFEGSKSTFSSLPSNKASHWQFGSRDHT